MRKKGLMNLIVMVDSMHLGIAIGSDVMMNV